MSSRGQAKQQIKLLQAVTMLRRTTDEAKETAETKGELSREGHYMTSCKGIQDLRDGPQLWAPGGARSATHLRATPARRRLEVWRPSATCKIKTKKKARPSTAVHCTALIARWSSEPTERGTDPEGPAVSWQDNGKTENIMV